VRRLFIHPLLAEESFEVVAVAHDSLAKAAGVLVGDLDRHFLHARGELRLARDLRNQVFELLNEVFGGRLRHEYAGVTSTRTSSGQVCARPARFRANAQERQRARLRRRCLGRVFVPKATSEDSLRSSKTWLRRSRASRSSPRHEGNVDPGRLQGRGSFRKLSCATATTSKLSSASRGCINNLRTNSHSIVLREHTEFVTDVAICKRALLSYAIQFTIISSRHKPVFWSEDEESVPRRCSSGRYARCYSISGMAIRGLPRARIRARAGDRYRKAVELKAPSTRSGGHRPRR